MDRNVLKTISDEHQRMGMKRIPEHRSFDRIEAYKQVLDFYSRLEDQLGPSGKRALEEADFHSQPRDSIRVQYGWLRVVDKWLWLRGRETNQYNCARTNDDGGRGGTRDVPSQVVNLDVDISPSKQTGTQLAHLQSGLPATGRPQYRNGSVKNDSPKTSTR